MFNSSFTSFILGAYLNVGGLKFFFFLVTLLLYMFIVCVNVSLIAVICAHRSLHEPMFVFLCSLFVNELCGSTGLFPFLLLQILSDVHVVPAPFCFLQIFCLYVYAHVEFCNLAAMAYDRYLAICCPLKYNRCMTARWALGCVCLLWCYSALKVLVTVSLNVRLPFCGNVINSLYCHNYLVAKLACSDSDISNIYGLVGVVLTVLVPLLPILFSYTKILRVCVAASLQTRQKAASTCSPHLILLLNFTFGCCFEILQSRFDTSQVPGALRVVLSLYFLLIQPLMTPLVYGMQMSQIRQVYRSLLRRRVHVDRLHV